MSKDKYKVCNWHHYNEGLKKRGAITLWIPKEALEQWRYSGERRRGGQKLYSDLALEVCLMVHKVYHLPLRQTEGFIRSVFEQAGLSVPIPDYTTLSRRASALRVNLAVGKRAITDIVVDSTGLKVYGEGEWKVRKYGWGKHRTWMKLHLALDAWEQKAWAVELSTNAVDDAEKVQELLAATDTLINSFKGDGAYDKYKVRELLCLRAKEQNQDILQVIALQKNAIMDVKSRTSMQQRDEDIKVIERIGRKQWKVLSNYHQRSKAETFMFRFKVILGGDLKARKFQNQSTEIKVGAKILNLMLQTAKPQSQKVS
jgi:Transposase DDE domain